MPKTLPGKPSPVAREAAEILGRMIRAARMERDMTAAELAERARVSRPLVGRVEKGDLKVSIGAVFELASILGVPLFEPDEHRMRERLERERRLGALLRKRANGTGKRRVDDDF